MERIRKTLILLLVAGIPAAAPPIFDAAPNLCFTAGSVTYQVAPGASSPDYRVRIADRSAEPDLRIALVDDVESADFALVDDFGGGGSACTSVGLVKTVQVVGEGRTADVTMSLSHEAAGADLKLFVHSVRFGHRDAAALFAAMQHYQHRNQLAAYR